MASGSILQDYGANIYSEMGFSLTDFNAIATHNRVVLGRWSGNTLNKPGGETFQGIYIHLSSSDNYAIQVAVNIGHGDRIYIRNKFNGTWSDWKTLTAS